jgi:transcriptional regulator with XRE-family HTH domain
LSKDVTPVDRHIGDRVRLRRNELRLSQQGLALKIGRSFQQVHKYEVGTSRIAASVLYDIARETETPITYFYDGLPYLNQMPLP